MYTSVRVKIVELIIERLFRGFVMENKDLERELKEILPLSPEFYVLSVLGSKTLHGYEIKKNVEQEMKKTVPTASLYRYVRSLRDDGLLEEVDMKIEGDDPRRQYFKVTGAGAKAYAAAYNRMRDFISSSPAPEGKAALIGGR